MLTIAAATLPKEMHLVDCRYCGGQFDLFTASWCEHRSPEASKICPHCTWCLCGHPAYAESNFWKEAPVGFQKQGFRRLFLFYL
jgi:hypothetical protein